MSGINDIDFYEPSRPPLSSGGSFDEELNTSSIGKSTASVEHLSAEEIAAHEVEWRQELEKTEEEIATLRQVLTWKIRKANELKRKLGITVWREVKGDIKQGWATLRESDTYQKTSSVARTAKEKTTTTVTSLTSKLGDKFGDLRNSSTFKGVEDRVGSAYSSVKQGLLGNRSTGNVPTGATGEDASQNNSSSNAPQKSA